MSATVLYDAPGPRGKRNSLIAGAIGTLVALGILGFILWRFADAGVFTAKQWQIFTFPQIWQRVGQATLNTLSAFGLAAVGAIVLGLVLATLRLSHVKIISTISMIVTEVLRAVPVLIMMLVIYYMPSGSLKLSPFWAVVIGLVLYNGSVLAEVFRSGIESLPRGQREAGLSIGLTNGQTLRMILMPQAIRAMLPLIVAQLVVALKDTALGFIVTYDELLKLAKDLGSQTKYGSPIIPAAIVTGSIYIVLCILLSSLAYWLQKRASARPVSARKSRRARAAAEAVAPGAVPLTGAIATQDSVNAGTTARVERELHEIDPENDVPGGA